MVSVLGGCSSDTAEESTEAGTTTTEDTAEDTTNDTAEDEVVSIVVGTMPNHIGVPIQYAYEQGYYEEAGLDVEIVIFSTGATINEALAAEQLDLAASGMASVYALAAGNTYWLGDIAQTMEGLSIYARADSEVLDYIGYAEDNENVYGSAEIVDGITVLGSTGTSDQFMAVCWAQQFGLASDDIEFLNMERSPAVQAFLSGEGDVIACGGPPYNYELEEAGCVVVGTLSEVSGIDCNDGLLGRMDWVDANDEATQKFIEATYKAVDELAADDDLLAEFALGFYNDNGLDYTEEMIWLEVGEKDYIGTEMMSQDDFYLGSTMIGMGGFYVDDGKIEPELEENIAASFNFTYLFNYLGFEANVYSE